MRGKWQVKRDLDVKIGLCLNLLFYHLSPTSPIIPLSSYLKLHFTCMGLKLHTHLDKSHIYFRDKNHIYLSDKSHIYFIMPENIVLLCYTILNILILCYIVLFSETPRILTRGQITLLHFGKYCHWLSAPMAASSQHQFNIVL